MLLRMLAPLLLVGWLSGHAPSEAPLLTPSGEAGPLSALSSGGRLVALDRRADGDWTEAAARLRARGVSLVVLRQGAPPGEPAPIGAWTLLYDPLGATQRAHPDAAALLLNADGALLHAFEEPPLAGAALERALQEIDALARRPPRYPTGACSQPKIAGPQRRSVKK